MEHNLFGIIAGTPILCDPWIWFAFASIMSFWILRFNLKSIIDRLDSARHWIDTSIEALENPRRLSISFLLNDTQMSNTASNPPVLNGTGLDFLWEGNAQELPRPIIRE
jgi:hypothetical protein